MKDVLTYLNFDGETRAAMEFYHKCLGGELQVMGFGDIPGGCPPEQKDRTMHARLTVNGREILMASDTQPGHKLERGNDFQVSVQCESIEEIERLFAAVGVGGKVVMPLDNMFWGARFGMLKDKFGVQWMFNCELPKG